jgi:hypothetical protein
MPSQTRKRARSPSPSKRIKKIEKILEGYYNYISRNPQDYHAVKRGEKFFEESWPMLEAQKRNRRNEVQKEINADELAQRTLSNMRSRNYLFKRHPRTAIGESPTRPLRNAFLSMYPKRTRKNNKA